MPAALMPTSRPHTSLSLVVGQGRREITSEELVPGLVSGEAWAIAEAWHRFAPMVTMMAERCLGSSSEAEDVCQEVFYRMLRRVKTLRQPERLRSFIYSVSLRVLKAELRRRKVRGWLTHLQAAPLDVAFQGPDIESRDLVARLYALLGRLTPRDRLVFVLRRMESKRVDEIATAMDISTSTVKRSMAHAASRLSRWVEADPGLACLVAR